MRDDDYIGGCEHVIRLKNYMKRNKLSLESDESESQVYCVSCENYYEVVLNSSGWADDEEDDDA